MSQLASMATTLAAVTSQPVPRPISVPAAVVAMLASMTGQLFSLLPAVQAKPPATAITPRVTGSARARYRAAAGHKSASTQASSARPATVYATSCAFLAVAPGGWMRNVSTPTTAKKKTRINQANARGGTNPSIAGRRSPGRGRLSAAQITHLLARAFPAGSAIRRRLCRTYPPRRYQHIPPRADPGLRSAARTRRVQPACPA